MIKYLVLSVAALPVLLAGPVPSSKPAGFPVWWFERDVISRLDTSVASPSWPSHYPVADDYAAVNQGQLKNIAKKAYEEFQSKLPGGAGPNLSAIWATPSVGTDDYTAINIGQLKNVAKPFYDRLVEVGYTGQPLTTGQLYPWSGSSSVVDNYALSNIGQVKNVFSFDPALLDGDHNGLIDSWEIGYFGHTGIDLGADPDRDDLTNAQEYAAGTDPTNPDSDGNGIPDGWEVAHAGELSVYPPAVSKSLQWQQRTHATLLLSNPTGLPVDYSVTISGNATGMNPVYETSDSTTGDATYVWNDISAAGTRLGSISDSEDSAEAVLLTQFSFPFFGQSYTSVYVSSNGLLSFGYADWRYTNESVLSVANSGNPIIAALWDDLNSEEAGDIYYLEQSDRLIIQYEQVNHRGGSGNYTFQVVLHVDGSIDIFYKDITGDATSATVGVAHADGSGEATQVTYGSTGLALTSHLAVTLRPKTTFVNVNSVTGTVPAHGVGTLDVKLSALTLPPGSHTTSLTVTYSQPGSVAWIVPVTINVIDTLSTVVLDPPSTTPFQFVSTALHVTATDPDFGITKVEFYCDDDLIGQTLTSGHSPEYYFYWTPKVGGSRNLKACAVDSYGNRSWSALVPVTITLDSDHDGLDDNWEITHFGNLSEGAEDDPDHDGLTNLQERAFGADPNNYDEDADDIPDGWELIYFGRLGVTASEGYWLDTDSNGISDWWEYKNFGHLGVTVTEADPIDMDSNGIPDWWEITRFGRLGVTASEGYWMDTDNNGISDWWEYKNFGHLGVTVTEAGPIDTDSDGIPDWWEITHFGRLGITASEAHGFDTDTNGISDWWEYKNFGHLGVTVTEAAPIDTDSDGIPDWWEITRFARLGITASEGYVFDADSNGISDWWEYKNFGHLGVTVTEAAPIDTDSDGIPDWWEITRFGRLGITASEGYWLDNDSNGISDWWEYKNFGHLGVTVTEAGPIDTDSDGIPDWWEITRFGSLDATLSQANAIDDDNNRLPDWWEYAHFGYKGVDLFADPDWDGKNNWSECSAGTDPLVSSLPVITLTAPSSAIRLN